MPDFDSVIAAVLRLIRVDWPGFSEEDLDRWVFSGYGDIAPAPHSSTLDLFKVYAMNLRNVAGPGPGMEPFGEMISSAMARFINHNAVQSLDVRQLAEACQQVLEEGNIRLRNAGNESYLDILQQIQRGNELPVRQQLLNLLISVVEFSKLLIKKYRGRADIYHESFLAPAAENHRELLEFVQHKIQEVRGLPYMGDATAPNFLKDSQCRSLLGREREWRQFGAIPYFVKPDRHVGRLISQMTRAPVLAGMPIEELSVLNESAVFQLFMQHPHDEGVEYPDVRNAAAGKWRCILDIWHWAEQAGVAPIAIDRLLYLAGSGNFHPSGQLTTPATDRYRAILELRDRA